MDVSILTRPYGRMLLATKVAIAKCLSVFQSSPALTGGCYSLSRGEAERDGAVSILTRPYGRMLCP